MTLVLLVVLSQAPGGWGEPAREAFLDPGARSILAGINAVSLDGLPPASTTFDFDGVKLLAPAHALFGPTALHPAWTTKPVTLGAPAARALGRTVSLFNRDSAPPETTRASIRVDLLRTGLFVEHGSGIQAAVSFFSTAALAGAFIKGSILLGDYQLRWTHALGDGQLRVLALGALNSLALTVSGIPLAARMQNHQADVRWKSDAIELGLGAHRSTIGLTLNGNVIANAIDGAEDAINARAIVSGKVMRAGIDFEVRRLTLLRGTSFTNDASANATSLRELGTVMVGGAFAEARITDGEWKTTLGVRVDLWAATNSGATVTADPRLATHRSFANDTVELELSAGIQHQAPSWLVTVPVLESIALRQGVQELARADASLTVKLAAKDFVSLHLFGGGLTRAIEFSPFDPNFLQLVNQAPEDVAAKITAGFIAGGDARLHFDFTRGWTELTYSFLESRRLVEGEWVAWQHRQTHQLRVLGGIALEPGWKLTASITLSSGPPMVGGLFSQQQHPGTDSLTGSPRWIPNSRASSADAQMFFRGDLRISKTWNPSPTTDVELFLDVANISAPQPTGFSYGTDSSTLALTQKNAASPLPPIPILGVDIRL